MVCRALHPAKGSFHKPMLTGMRLARVKEAMARALSMPLEERIERWRDMMAVISGNTLSDWRDSFISDLKAVKR